MDLNELKKLLDMNKHELSEMLRQCKDGSPEQSLLESKMSPLLESFSAIEEELFAHTYGQTDQGPKQDKD